jgi:hypothetical protein
MFAGNIYGFFEFGSECIPRSLLRRAAIVNEENEVLKFFKKSQI